MTRISDLDFGIAQRALESLGTNLDDLAKRRAWELDDALDAHLQEPMSEERRWPLAFALQNAVAQHGVLFLQDDRFSEYAEMARWVRAAAEARGFAVHEKGVDPRWLCVDTPAGDLQFSIIEAHVSLRRFMDADGASAKLARELLRAAQALQALGSSA